MKHRVVNSFVFFEVTNVDGSQSSSRKVRQMTLEDLGGEAAIKAVVEAQDRKTGLASGRPRGEIKSVKRS
jgi:signal transduction histidine kinase